MRSPLATSTFLMPGVSLAARMTSMSSLWSVLSNLQIVGWTQDCRRQIASTSGLVHFI